jgi:hypothetical protein
MSGGGVQLSAAPTSKKNEILLNKKLLLLFENISYGGDINVISGKYSVINTADNDQNLQLKSFEEKMLQINKHFSYSEHNYKANFFTDEFFTDFRSLYKKIISDKIISDNNNIKEYIKCMKLILVIYIYIMEWDNKDPYILIKLNKIIFGRVANIQNIKIDEDIENIISLRSIIPYETGKYTEPDIVKIYRGVCLYLDNDNVDGTNVKNVKGVSENNDIYSFNTEPDVKIYKDFQDKFKKILEYDIKKNTYYFNLYLALEMGLNILVILIILIILKLMTSSKDSEFEKNITYAQLFSSRIFTQIAISFSGIINVLRLI